MAKSLIIVESPAKARTIERFLGRKYAVKASMGHVRDLPKSQFGVDIEHQFEPKYITIRGKGEVLKELKENAKKALSSAGKVFLATDPDREGEAISWHLAEALGLSNDDANRIEFHEITKEAIQRALKTPRKINESLVEAQQARRILDRLVGYKLSPLLWRKVRRGLSAGRVQSAALRLICDREAEITAFRSEEYWTITASFLEGNKAQVQAGYWGRDGAKRDLPNRAAVDEVLHAVDGRPFVVTSIKRRERRRHPAAPFTTSSLQQEAARKLGFTVRRTMSVAQQLYEGLDIGEEGTVGVITYIRTDSTRVSDTAKQDGREYIERTWSREHVSNDRREDREKKENEKKGVQGAHEAIRPTSVFREPEKIKPHLTSDQYKLYRLVWERFVSSLMAPAVLDTVTVDIAAGPEIFRATGSTVKFAGFMVIYVEGRDDEDRDKPEEAETFLPELNEGQNLSLKELMPKQHFTQPPPRYSEAMLVKALEERGIGRPSTYAPIIETIQQRGYVVREERRFLPTELGLTVLDLLKQYFPNIVDVEFTAALEESLDSIEEGQENWRQVLSEFYDPFQETLVRAEEEIGNLEVPEEESNVQCDKCGMTMVIRYGRFGKFLACPGFPECRNTKPILEETGVPCPRCGGSIVERKSKKHRRFYGCSNYPECDFVSWQRPVNRKCPECGSFLVQKKTKEHGPHYACPTDGCGHVEPIESESVEV